MIAERIAGRRRQWDARALAGVILLLGGLAGSVALRWMALRSALPMGADGLLFGVALLGLAATVGAPGAVPKARPSRPAVIERATGLLIGLLGGFVLVGVPLCIRAFGTATAVDHPFPGTYFAFPVWAALTITVAVAEEAVLRGALFDVGLASLGAMPTVAISSVAFALLHVPFYGWGIVPLDIAVGVWLSGLRLVGGSVTAPAVAHVVADLATWWL